MKYPVLILMGVFIALQTSCSKTGSSNRVLSGQWRYIYAFGGIGLSTIKPSPDSIETLKFDPGFTYQTYTNGHLRLQGNYYFTTSQSNYVIHFKPQNGGVAESEWTLSRLTSDSLKLSDNNPDGFEYHYAKIR